MQKCSTAICTSMSHTTDPELCITMCVQHRDAALLEKKQCVLVFGALEQFMHEVYQWVHFDCTDRLIRVNISGLL